MPLLPVAIPHTDAGFARGIRAGNWIFATGQSATDFVNGMASGHPLDGEPPAECEARGVFGNIEEVLAAAGAGLRDVVRIDQYYTNARTVASYHEVRREVFAGRIPPSTSNLHQKFACSGQSIEVQVMATLC